MTDARRPSKRKRAQTAINRVIQWRSLSVCLIASAMGAQPQAAVSQGGLISTRGEIGTPNESLYIANSTKSDARTAETDAQSGWSGSGIGTVDPASCASKVGTNSVSALEEGFDSTSWKFEGYSGGTVLTIGYRLTDSEGEFASGSISGASGVITASRAPVSEPTVSGTMAVSAPSGEGHGTIRCSVTYTFGTQN